MTDTVELSGDGLIRSNGSQAGNDFLVAWNHASAEHGRRKAIWVRSMLRMGAKVVTPDDGWVDRARNTVSPPHYASYHRPAQSGDSIALGTFDRWRLVEITGVSRGLYDQYIYQFNPSPIAIGVNRLGFRVPHDAGAWW